MMATKRTGKPHGRPKKHEAGSVKREAHRPAVPFLEDPDRWLVALILDLHWHGGKSMRNAAKIIAAVEVGNEINASDPDYAPVYEKCPSGMKVVAFGPIGGILENGEFKNTFAGSRAASIKGRADTLRRKVNAALRDPSNQFWVTLVPPAIALLRHAADQRVLRPLMIGAGHGVVYIQASGKTAMETARGMLRAAGEGSAAATIGQDWAGGTAPDVGRLGSAGEPTGTLAAAK